MCRFGCYVIVIALYVSGGPMMDAGAIEGNLVLVGLKMGGCF